MPTRSNLLTPSPPIADPSNPETPDIKPLASLFPHAGQPRWVQEDRDLARTDFFKEVSEYCDLTTEVAVWRYTREVHPSFTINHRMDPRPEMEDMFPLRDPLDPRKVHRRYANASGELDGRVAVYAVESLREALRTLMKSCGIPHQDHMELCKQLEADVGVELDRLIKGHRRAPYYEVRKLQVHEVADHEQALIGQYGLFGLPHEHPQRQPVLENGRVLGLFVGALLQNAEEEDAYAQAYPGHSSYTVTFQVKNQSKNKRNRTRLVGVTGLGV
ncbi:hypothetical protein SAMN05216359_1031, partial [Roseateles sp. YR242]|uniref:hypothetical protein n=1 Tax=Roseateles sp. YR242 TaxID=1855305 RepID=UPI0008ACC3C2